MRGEWQQGSYHFVMYVFLANEPAMVPDGFCGHHVTAVRQMRPSEVRPHPTDMRILNDAGVAGYPEGEIEAALAGEGITMTGHLTSTGVRMPVLVDR
jgi:8-oxo-dGTP diphosphatase